MNESDVRQSILNAVSGDLVGLKSFTDIDSPIMDSFEEVADDIAKKLKGYSDVYPTKFVALKNGYIFYATEPRILVSFCLHVDSRTPRGLNEFWNSIIEHVGSEFVTVLWSKNTRAIKWLTSRGMTIHSNTEYGNGTLTKLTLCLQQ